MFDRGRVYRRNELHYAWDGATRVQQQGGTLTPVEAPLVVVVTGELTVLRVISEREIPTNKLHGSNLAGAVVVEHAVRVPEIVVAVLPTLLAGHDDHDGRLDGGK